MCHPEAEGRRTPRMKWGPSSLTLLRMTIQSSERASVQLLALFFAISILALGACASKSENDNNAGNGVDDVKKACDARGVWTRSKETSCFSCTSFVASAPCSCN